MDYKDVIENFIEAKSKRRETAKLSDFLTSCESLILRHDYGMHEPLELKRAWVGRFIMATIRSNYKKCSTDNVDDATWCMLVDKKIEHDYKIIRNQIKKKQVFESLKMFDRQVVPVSESLQKESRSGMKELKWSIMDEAVNKLMQARVQLKHETRLHKQDLLYYGILDLTRKGPSSSKLALGTDYNELLEQVSVAEPSDEIDLKDEPRLGTPGQAYSFSKSITIHVNKKSSSSKRLNKCLKKRLKELNENKLHTYEKQVHNMAKICTDRLDFNNPGESHYQIEFVAPLLKEILVKNHKKGLHLGIHWCQSLKAHERSIDEAQPEDERKARAVIPDGVIYDRDMNTELCLIEIAGPPDTTNHQHYLGDKNKLGKSMKIMLQTLAKKYEGDREALYKVRLYGLLLYREQMQIFKLWMPKERLYVFKRCRTIDLDIKPTTFAERFPVVVRELWRLKNDIITSAISIRQFIESEPSSSIRSLDSVYISPNKRQRTR